MLEKISTVRLKLISVRYRLILFVSVCDSYRCGIAGLRHDSFVASSLRTAIDIDNHFQTQKKRDSLAAPFDLRPGAIKIYSIEFSFTIK